MEWLSVIAEHYDPVLALLDCIEEIKKSKSKPRRQPNLALLFATAENATDYPMLAGWLKQELNPKTVLGCSGGGVIGGGREVEHKPAVSLVCAWLPGVRIHPFHLEQGDLPSPDDPPGAWRKAVGFEEKGSATGFLLFADPFSMDPEALARGLDFAFPGSVKVGGMASGGSRPGGNRLYLDDMDHSSGAVGAAFTGNVAIDPVVAQGCRPIGVPFQITECEKNLLVKLDGFNALAVLQKLFESLPEEDRELARTSLFLGLLNNPMKSGTSKRDYLIRNLIGLDPERGTLAVGAVLRPGQTVQFHLRDSRTSAEDLEERLAGYLKSGPPGSPKGALLFSCLGRGQHLYDRPNHDTDLFVKKLGKLPLGGFFCNGEIGPVDGTTYIHGYTSSFGIFREADRQPRAKAG